MLGFTLCAALSVPVVDQLQSTNADNEKVYLSKQNPKWNYGVLYVQSNPSDISGNVICKQEDWKRYSDPKLGGYLNAPKSSEVPRDATVSAYVYTWGKNPTILHSSTFNDGIIIKDGPEGTAAPSYTDEILRANRAVNDFIRNPKSIRKCKGPNEL